MPAGKWKLPAGKSQHQLRICQFVVPKGNMINIIGELANIVLEYDWLGVHFQTSKLVENLIRLSPTSWIYFHNPEEKNICSQEML